MKCHKISVRDGGEGGGSRRAMVGGGKVEQEEEGGGGEEEGTEALTEELIHDILGPEDDTQ